MGANTKIEWADHTFNPWVGCQRVSPGCDNCYAAVSTPARARGMLWAAGEPRQRTTSTWGDPRQWNAQHDAFYAQHGRRQRVFCASLADVFDNAVPPEWRSDLFDLIRATPNLDWMLLTKRIGNALHMLPADFNRQRYPHVWLGATVVNQEELDRDVPKLLALNARVRFLSMEPLLSQVTFQGRWIEHPNPAVHVNWLEEISWVIVGGESGRGARPIHPDWVRGLRDECAAVGTPFLFKQWGEFLPRSADSDDPALADVPDSRLYWSDGSRWERQDGQRAGVDLVARVGKKAAGRLLDGRTHDEFPEAQP